MSSAIVNKTIEFNVTEAVEESVTEDRVSDGLPDYVCCVVTEGAWTYFASTFLIVVLLSVATIKYCKKRLAKPKFLPEGRKLHMQSVLADDRGAIHTIRHDPIPVSEFTDYCVKRRKHKRVHKLEFQRIIDKKFVKEGEATLSMALREENEAANRNTWSVPYDHNRVRLRVFPKGSNDYVNASYIHDENGRVQSVVAQGPKENTVSAFWQVVWQEGVTAIVMLTRTFEFIKIMCVQYWPLHSGKPDRHGPLDVITEKEETYACFKEMQHQAVELLIEMQFQIYHLSVEHRETHERRNIVHFHFLEWPAFATPAPNALLQFRRRLLEELSVDSPPPLIHCSDGGARCGTFVAVMNCLASAASERQEVDVIETMRRLRLQRRSLLSDPEQLRYVYDVVEDHLLCGDTAVPIEDILSRLQAKSERREENGGLTDYEREHKLLDSLLPRFTIGDCAAGHRAENRHKNRNALVVPPDNQRPYLRSCGDDDYINAVHVDGFSLSNEFLVTEWPLAHTQAAFWSMVYDHEVRTVVVLNCNRSGALGGTSFPSFWPQQNTKENYGGIFTVNHVTCSQFENKFAVWDLHLTKQGLEPERFASPGTEELSTLTNLLNTIRQPPRRVRLFQLQCWSNTNKVPDSTYALVHLINEVDIWREDISKIDADVSKSGGRVVVVSNDGYTRCGIYCAAAACLEQVRHRKEVDVFQAVKTLRKSRTELVASPTEYKNCYDVVLHYVLHYCSQRQTRNDAMLE